MRQAMPRHHYISPHKIAVGCRGSTMVMASLMTTKVSMPCTQQAKCQRWLTIAPGMSKLNSKDGNEAKNEDGERAEVEKKDENVVVDVVNEWRTRINKSRGCSFHYFHHYHFTFSFCCGYSHSNYLFYFMILCRLESFAWQHSNHTFEFIVAGGGRLQTKNTETQSDQSWLEKHGAQSVCCWPVIAKERKIVLPS